MTQYVDDKAQLKIVFLGTSQIGVPILSALLLEHDVLAIITSPDAAVGRKQTLTPSAIALKGESAGVPVFKPEVVKDDQLTEQLKTLNADIFVVVSYGKILPMDIIQIPRLGTINVHFSLLPKYRGSSPVQTALLNGDTKTGTTIFLLDEKVDHGPILSSVEQFIDPTDTNTTLQEKLAITSSELIIKTLAEYAAGNIVPRVQDETQATKCKKIAKEDGLVDWTKSAQEIYNQFRAYQPWPGIYTKWQDKTLKIIDCQLSPDGQNLELITVQLEGKNPVAIKDFLNGHPDFSVEKLKKSN